MILHLRVLLLRELVTLLRINFHRFGIDRLLRRGSLFIARERNTIVWGVGFHSFHGLEGGDGGFREGDVEGIGLVDF